MLDLARFSQLPPGAQFLLQILSVHYGPISATSLLQLVMKIPDNPLTYHRLLPKDLRVQVEQLSGDGWIEQVDASKFRCDPQVRDDLTRHCLGGGQFPDLLQSVADFARLNETPRSFGYYSWPNAEIALRDLRLLVLLGNGTRTIELLSIAQYQYSHDASFRPHPWVTLWGKDLDPEWLPFFSDSALVQLIAPYYIPFGTVSNPLWQRCREVLLRNPDTEGWDRLGGNYYWQMLLRGELDDPLAAQPADDAGLRLAHWRSFSAAMALCRGEITQAQTEHRAGLALLRKLVSRRKATFGGYLELFYLLALLLDGDSKSLTEATNELNAHAELQSFKLLGLLAKALQTGKCDDAPVLAKLGDTPFMGLLTLLVRYWTDLGITPAKLNQARDLQRQATDQGMPWLAEEYDALFAHLGAKGEALSAPALPVHERHGLRPLFQLYRPAPLWERALKALQRVGSGGETGGKARAPQTEERLIWVLEKNKFSDRAHYSLTPKLQKLNRKAGWSGGRNVALKRLREEPGEFPFLTDQDRRLCLAIEEENSAYYGGRVFSINLGNAWSALAGHPNVYWAGAIESPLDIQYGREELLILREGSKLRVRLVPELKAGVPLTAGSHLVVEESTSQLLLYKLTPTLLQMHDILGSKGLLVPKEAEPGLRQTIEALAPMITIQSDIGGMDNATEVAADPRPRVQLLPWAKGLRLLMRVRPFGAIGPFFPPGAGRGNLIAEVENRLLRTSRNLKQERQESVALLQECPALAGWEDVEDDLLLEEPEQCLEALGQLHGLGERIELSWPEGERLRITQPTGQGSLSLKVRHGGDWFELDGKVQVNEGLVLSLRQLLELNRSAVGRFLPLADGQYLTLTRQFQKRLEALAAVVEEGKHQLKVGALAGLLLEDLVEEAGEVEADDQWRRQTRRLKAIRDSQPPVPAGLQAELRDYQEEGFRWMARLADWGVGACLADDMGLGKTVQTLALLLTRAAKGPALVVAPTSVCNNWHSECQKFAPSLRPLFYRGRERQQLLEVLLPGDLLICSYGLLQQDAELFQQRRWSSIVLDEAQAIKNTLAKRTQAAYQLQGDFRLITTGTPIENHLGELWSLFRFLNPGLLLSQQKFGERFVQPIARDDEKARHQLKRLVQPFMLRRTKNQVLQELPPRTEITLSISLSDEEMALYEALRQQAMARLSGEEAGLEHRQLEVLAEITRLRLAACHPQLAMPGSALPSSKLQAFSELVTELRENQHKALVFSQFVKHLDLIRAWLDQEAIPYQYLDGSTPAAARQQRVEAFQRGEGDVFLISLKAGGFGLNLTAADYVIHMDPWWNPAVEDQASDRAHRIGQQRPVTVYRLVAENTIEEKIVKLHQFKRDLADSLLEGSDLSGKMSAREMLEMIRGAG